MEENNKVCSNCGKSNDYTSSFCSNCGKPLNQNDVMNSQQNNVQNNVINNDVLNNQVNNVDDKEGDSLGIISLILYFLGSAFAAIFAALFPITLGEKMTALSGLLPLAGIVIMIVGRVKYPKNKVLRAAMWAIIISILVELFFALFLFMWCTVTCASASPTGCS